MSDSASRQIPANKVGLYLLVLLAVWLAFSFFPRDKKPPPVVVVPPVAESKLHAVGLEENPDWEGLPEFFAVWAGQAGWKDDRAQFAYWNPGSSSYSYYFEAIRESGRIRFHTISQPNFLGEEANLEGGSYLQYKGGHEVVLVAETDLKADSPTHPFVFFKPVPADTDRFRMADVLLKLEHERIPTDRPKIKVDVRPALLDVTRPEPKGATPTVADE